MAAAQILSGKKFLEALDLGIFLEPVEADYSSLDWKKAVRLLRTINHLIYSLPQ